MREIRPSGLEGGAEFHSAPTPIDADVTPFPLEFTRSSTAR